MDQDRALNVGIVGGGPGCKAIMGMIFAEKLSELRMKLVGVASTNTEAVGYLYAKERGLYTTEDYHDLYELKDLNMIIELTGRNEIALEISQTKPDHIRFMDHVTARVFWDVFQIEEERSQLKETEDMLRETTRRLQLAYDQSITYAEDLTEEIVQRKGAEKALQEARDKLEQRVEARTAELTESVAHLEEEITERKQTQDALRRREIELQLKKNSLEEANTALRVLLKQREDDRTDLQETVLSNVKELVVPFVEKLKRTRLEPKQTSYLDILESNLNGIVAPFAQKLSSKYLGLTPSEIQIAHLVKDGRTTKEISELLNVSAATVESHRKGIRMKIGIRNTKANLRSYLLSM